ncbi:MAG TPA: FlgD immunoglobulin-like domain containing protein, partial [Candidatus Krumholzibacteria bacterium]|nr:FlgD immunoglobulin-like domain containing protein [Candidatus Krumholzibacteria bacterium]
RYRGEDADNWYVDDALLTAKYRNDVGITAYAPPPWPGRQGFGFDHRIVIQNLGTQPLVNASLHWRLDDPQGNLFAEETRDLSGVGPGQEQAYTFYTTPTFTGFTASQAWVETQNDEDPGNDAVFGGAWTYSLGRKSIGLLGFSDNHAPSQEAEYPFDVFPEIADNTLGLIRLPSPVPGGDPSALYYNASQDIDRMRAMTGRTGVPAPPEFDADNVLDDAALFYINLPWKRGLAGWSEVPAAWLALSQNAGAPLALSTAMVWDNGTYGGFLDVTVEVVDDLKPGVDYVLYAAMVEDDASGSGHDQVLRDLFPNIDGQVIDPTPGTAVYPVYVGRAEENVPENLRLVTFVVEHNGDGSYGAIVNGSVRWWLDSSTPVDDAPPAVARTRLVGNAPNPFNPSTVITYDLARPGTVTLEVFDVGGRLVRRLENGTLQSAGRHQVRWDGRDQAGRAAPSGAYFSRLVADGRSETRGMVLVK